MPGAVKLSDDVGGGAIPLWLITLTLASTLGFTIAYGHDIFNISFDNCGSISNLVGCGAEIFGFIGAIFDIMFLGGFASPLPILIQGPLLLIMALGWAPVIMNQITRAIEAVGSLIP